MAPGCSMTGSGTLVCHGSPALPAVPVTLRNGRLHCAFPGAVAGFTASQGVEVEGIHLADFTLGPDCAGWTEALPRHLVTKASATVASCRGTKRRCIRVGLHKPLGFPGVPMESGDMFSFPFCMGVIVHADLSQSYQGSQGITV